MNISDIFPGRNRLVFHKGKTIECTKCGRVLTDDKGRRIGSANHDVELAYLKKKDTDEKSYAWCNQCYASLLFAKHES